MAEIAVKAIQKVGYVRRARMVRTGAERQTKAISFLGCYDLNAKLEAGLKTAGFKRKNNNQYGVYWTDAATGIVVHAVWAGDKTPAGSKKPDPKLVINNVLVIKTDPRNWPGLDAIF